MGCRVEHPGCHTPDEWTTHSLWCWATQYHAPWSTTDASRSIYDAALLWHVESWMHEVERPNTSHDIIRGIDTPEMTSGTSSH